MTEPIVEYDPRWPAQFELEAERLRHLLGGQVLRIDHIGSTSVPGLAAKDVIDVQITVAALDKRALVAPLSSLGYHFWDIDTCDHVPPGRTDTAEEWSKLYFSEPPGQRPTHVHVRQAGWLNQRYALLFRDYLRRHPDKAADYESLKRHLAGRFGGDDAASREAYASAKSCFIDAVDVQ